MPRTMKDLLLRHPNLINECHHFYNECSYSIAGLANYLDIGKMTLYNYLRQNGFKFRDKLTGQLMVDHSGVNNPMYGVKWSQQARKEQSDKIKAAIERNGGHWAKGIKHNLTPEQREKRARRGSENNHWKGGRTVRSDGYVLIYAPEHPYCSKTNKVYEHRLVMEKHLGRYLSKDEVVHHVNGNPSDNRIENLIVFTQQSHVRYHVLLDCGRRKDAQKVIEQNGYLPQV